MNITYPNADIDFPTVGYPCQCGKIDTLGHPYVQDGDSVHARAGISHFVDIRQPNGGFDTISEPAVCRG